MHVNGSIRIRVAQFDVMLQIIAGDKRKRRSQRNHPDSAVTHSADVNLTITRKL
jgi:hypothetical protein